MILKRIILKNIRSYKDQTVIEIPEGRTLFQGDIGCGKSTILSAIEFALFGLGDIDGNNLLRTSQLKGSVVLEFEVKNKKYEVYRSLTRRGKTVTQDKGHIVDDGVETNYSTSEMKSKILEIININEKTHTKTTSVIYRFAIFIPQEMMKQILEETVEKRLEILRRAFSIEEYSAARKSTVSIIIPWIREKISWLTGVTNDLPEKEVRLTGDKNKEEMISKTIEKISDETKKLDLEDSKLQTKKQDLMKKKDIVIQLQETMPYLEDAIVNKKKSKESLMHDSEKSNEDLKSIQKSQDILNEIKPLYEDYTAKKNSLSKLQKLAETYDNVEKEKTRLEQSIGFEKQRLELELIRLKTELDKENHDLEKEKESLAKLDSLEKEEVFIREQLEEIPILRKELSKLESSISKENTLIKSSQDNLSHKQIEVEYISKIGEGAPCPKCKQKLTVEHIIKVKKEFEDEKSKIKEEVEHLTENVTNYNKQKNDKDTKITDLENKEYRLKQIQRDLGKLLEKKDSVELSSSKLRQKEKNLDDITAILDQQNYSAKERKKLDEISNNINKLFEGKNLYEKLKNQVNKYNDDKIPERYVENLQLVKRKPEIENNLKNIQVSIDSLDKGIDSDTKSLDEKRILFNNTKEVITLLRTIEEQDKSLQLERIEKGQTLASKNTELQGLRFALDALVKEVEVKKELHADKEILQQANNWLGEIFVPTIEDIEKHVLQSINEEFNQIFQTWFSMLVEAEDIGVEVDESFTPVITHSGYPLDINSLSGGEKTSVALAYRLALNKMLKQKTSMENSLLILDEPTDGFGKEQLIRLREVLDEMKSAQIILVSHERELESFVDKIYRITKEGNVSRVEPIGT